MIIVMVIFALAISKKHSMTSHVAMDQNELKAKLIGLN